MSNLDVHDISPDDPGAASGARPYIGVEFACCGVYTRVYRRPEQTRYDCRCPRCLRMVTVHVGPQGTSNRFFRAE